MQEKGSLKNKISDFFKIQKLKRKKAEENEKKKKEQQIRFYNRKKIILLTIIGLFIGLFEPRKKQKQDINKINKQITIIELKLEKSVTKDEIEKIENKLFNINFKLKRIKLKNKKEVKKIETKLISISKKAKTKKEQIENNIESKNKISEDNHFVEKIPLKKKNISNVVLIGGLSAHVVGKVTKEVIDGLYFSNEKTKENQKTDDIINQDIKTIDSTDIKEENAIYQEDDYEVSDKENKETEKWILDKKDIEISLDIIQKELLEQAQKIEKFKINLTNMDFQSKNKTMLAQVGFLMKGLINITFSFLPLKLFKNKYIGTITSAIILNSRIKYLKKIMGNQDSQIKLDNYKFIIKEIKGKNDALLKIKEININSLTELENIKKEMEIKYETEFNNQEVMTVLARLDKTKDQLLNYNEMIDKKMKKNNQIEVEQKQKIKKLEST